MQTIMSPLSTLSTEMLFSSNASARESNVQPWKLAYAPTAEPEPSSQPSADHPGSGVGALARPSPRLTPAQIASASHLSEDAREHLLDALDEAEAAGLSITLDDAMAELREHDYCRYAIHAMRGHSQLHAQGRARVESAADGSIARAIPLEHDLQEPNTAGFGFGTPIRDQPPLADGSHAGPQLEPQTTTHAESMAVDSDAETDAARFGRHMHLAHMPVPPPGLPGPTMLGSGDSAGQQTQPQQTQQTQQQQMQQQAHAGPPVLASPHHTLAPSHAPQRHDPALRITADDIEAAAHLPEDEREHLHEALEKREALGEALSAEEAHEALEEHREVRRLVLALDTDRDGWLAAADFSNKAVPLSSDARQHLRETALRRAKRGPSSRVLSVEEAHSALEEHREVVAIVRAIESGEGLLTAHNIANAAGISEDEREHLLEALSGIKSSGAGLMVDRAHQALEEHREVVAIISAIDAGGDGAISPHNLAAAEVTDAVRACLAAALEASAARGVALTTHAAHRVLEAHRLQWADAM